MALAFSSNNTMSPSNFSGGAQPSPPRLFSPLSLTSPLLRTKLRLRPHLFESVPLLFFDDEDEQSGAANIGMILRYFLWSSFFWTRIVVRFWDGCCCCVMFCGFAMQIESAEVMHRGAVVEGWYVAMEMMKLWERDWSRRFVVVMQRTLQIECVHWSWPEDDEDDNSCAEREYLWSFLGVSCDSSMKIEEWLRMKMHRVFLVFSEGDSSSGEESNDWEVILFLFS